MVKKEESRKVARALLKRVLEKEERLRLLELLDLLEGLYKRSKEFRNFFLNPRVEVKVKEKFIGELLKRLNLKGELLEVFSYVIEANLLPFINSIKRSYLLELKRQQRISKAKIYLPKRDELLVKEIVNRLRQILKRDIEYEVVEKPELIGGFLVETDSYQIDASVKGILEGIKV